MTEPPEFEIGEMLDDDQLAAIAESLGLGMPEFTDDDLKAVLLDMGAAFLSKELFELVVDRQMKITVENGEVKYQTRPDAKILKDQGEA